MATAAGVTPARAVRLSTEAMIGPTQGAHMSPRPAPIARPPQKFRCPGDEPARRARGESRALRPEPKGWQEQRQAEKAKRYDSENAQPRGRQSKRLGRRRDGQGNRGESERQPQHDAHRPQPPAPTRRGQQYGQHRKHAGRKDRDSARDQSKKDEEFHSPIMPQKDDEMRELLQKSYTRCVQGSYSRVSCTGHYLGA